jgi:hypothetical protein
VTTPSASIVRDTELALARLHLRLGALALARAELETMAGRDALDAEGLVDLAEARWRTGDVAGAGEAAAVVISDDEDGLDGPLIALVIAAEAALLRGRPTEARRFATRAMEVAGGSIDPVFAGMPRGPVWPADATVLPAPAPTLFETPIAGSALTEAAAAAAGDATRPATSGPGPDADAFVEPATLALWATLEAAAGPGDQAGPIPGSSAPGPGGLAEVGIPDGAAALAKGEAALEAGDVNEASLQLGLALRLTPALAPAVIERLDGRPERGLALVRGDAYRLVGRELDAQRAFADAARPDHPRADPAPPSPEGDPA